MIEPEYLKRRNSLVISPNLGHPLYIGIDSRLKQRKFEIKLLFASNIPNLTNFEGFLTKNLKLVPILEYKWKLTKLLEKTKKKGIWDKLKSFFFRGKKRRQETQEIKEFTDSKGDTFDIVQREKLEKLKPRAFRGDIIDCVVLNVQNAYEREIDNPEYDDYLSPQNYLVKHEIFGSLNKFYSATINFSLTDEVIEFLKSFNFVMFDILQQNPNKGDRINYHSIVISKNDWVNFKFLHATDLHLAERNDRIYEIVKKWQKSVRKSEVGEIVAQSVKAVSYFQRLLMKKPEEKVETTKPLSKRYINPNNNFRNFIKQANKSVNQNDLDFVVLTGDIIDFSILSKINKEKRKTLDFNYDFSNWRIFKEILLNHPQKMRRGMITGDELLCPIFTIPGNHDFRPYHYDLRWGNLYKKIGLNGNEAIALNDELMANPISSITKNFRALKAYLIEINSSLDFSLKLGENIFIFLNSGSDSFKNIIDFVSGHPSVTGVSNKQIRYLEDLINKTIKPGDNTFLMVHGPPINPKKTMSKRFSLSKPKDKMPSLKEFKESIMEKMGELPSAIRINDKFDLKFGTISSNWAKIIKFCLDYSVLTLSGHTHQLKEFRLTNPQQKSINPNTAIPVKLTKLENPAVVYYDYYSERLKNQKEVEINAPFVVQTPALGLGSYHKPVLAGAYREIIIEKGKLTSFQVKYVKR
ncbi:MAG: metallophosphoesterase [Candidatus Lokiarchaeota archaeon]|nr:metallophosphoesterase [Candidatus Lokiarchaeota archaeon]